MKMTTLLVVRGFAISKKVKLGKEELAELTALTEDEKLLLRELAPAAAPYLQKILAMSDKIAAALFFASYGFMLDDRFKVIREKAKAQKAARGEPERQIEGEIVERK